MCHLFRQRLSQLSHLGNQWVMKQPADYRNPQGNKSFTLRIMDKVGRSYGEFNVPFTCGDTCHVNTDA